MPVAAPITEDNSTMLLRKMVWNSYDLAFNAAPVVYTNTAFLSSTGDDNTAVLNDPNLPYETLEAALIALLAEYPGEEVTVRVLDDGVDATVNLGDLGYTGVGYIIIRGHGGVKTMTGTIDHTGDEGDPPSNGFDIVLWDIELAASGGSGGDAEGVDQDGGNGGDVYLIGDAAVGSFTSNGGNPAGAGATGSAGKERTVILLPDGEPQRNPDGTFDTYPVP